MARSWADAFVMLVTGAVKLWWATAARMILAVSWTASRVLQLAASSVGIMVPSTQYTYDWDTQEGSGTEPVACRRMTSPR